MLVISIVKNTNVSNDGWGKLWFWWFNVDILSIAWIFATAVFRLWPRNYKHNSCQHFVCTLSGHSWVSRVIKTHHQTVSDLCIRFPAHVRVFMPSLDIDASWSQISGLVTWVEWRHTPAAAAAAPSRRKPWCSPPARARAMTAGAGDQLIISTNIPAPATLHTWANSDNTEDSVPPSLQCQGRQRGCCC